MEDKTINVGDTAPDFTLEAADGSTVTLKDRKGSWTILYFYPKDNTPGCTIEAIDFTANHAQIQELGAEVYGVSADSIKSHCGFVEKQSLSIPLLSDPDKTVMKAYGAFGKKKMYGKEVMGVIRSTFIIDPEGIVAAAWHKVKAKGHAEKVISKLEELV